MERKNNQCCQQVRKNTKSPLQRTIRRFFSRKLSIVGLFLIGIIIFIAIFGNVLCPYNAAETNTPDRFQGPSATHLFGTDDLGRDVFARIIDGARITLKISIGAVVLALIVGTVLGLASGYYGGIVDRLLSGFMDALWAFPALVLAMAINVALGTSALNILIAIGIVSVPNFFRLARSRALSIREMEYVTGAKAIGLTDGKIIFRYVLPNMSSTLIVQFALSCASAALSEATLSFLGLGVPLPSASWGTMLKNGFTMMSRAPWLILFPALFIMILVLGLNFIGDGLRDAMDVHIATD